MKDLVLPDLTPILPWYQANKRDLPWRHTRDPYRIWISEIMLQQTRVEAVKGYYQRFLDRLPDIESLAAVPDDELMKLWEGLGYYSRARNLKKAAVTVCEKHGGAFPQAYEEVLALSGIGEYTAGAICSFAFDLPYPAVDGNVLRVAARLLSFEGDILDPKNKKELTAAVEAAQPAAHAADFNQAMIELGATVCLPNGVPKCESCPLAGVCAARRAGRECELPVRKKPAPRKIEERTVLILRAGDTVALQKRPETGLLSGLFEPFCLAGKRTLAEVAAYLAEKGITPLYLTPLEDAKHIFSHIEWHMIGYEVILSPEDALTVCETLSRDLFFAPRDEIDKGFAIPAAYRAYRPYM